MRISLSVVALLSVYALADTADARRCPRGMHFNYRLQRCVRNGHRPPPTVRHRRHRYDPPRVRHRHRYDDGPRVRHVRRRECAPGWRWSNYYDRCVRRPNRCPPGTRYNGVACVSWRKCPPDMYYSYRFHSCRPKHRNCPYGYRYRPGWGCSPICPSGWNYVNGSCRRAARTCPESMFYSYGLRRCVRRCGPGSYWSYRRHRCVRTTW